MKNFAEAIDKKVFIAGGLFCLLFLIWMVAAPDQAEAEAQAALRAMDGDARSILATAAADIPWSASEETIAAIPRAAGEYDRKAAAH